jgi:hypothetical protein
MYRAHDDRATLPHAAVEGPGGNGEGTAGAQPAELDEIVTGHAHP